MKLFNEWKLAATSDSHGRYSLTNLPAGQYTVCALMPADTESESSPVCLGNVFRRAGAKSVKVAAGELLTGVDIEAPISVLHSVAGTVTARSDGHGIPRATVRLLWADDKENARETKSEEDGTFRLEYVPEGKFLLEVSSAQDPGDTDSNAPEKNHPAVRYADKQSPLTVQAAVDDLNIALDPKRPAPTPKPPPQP